jgi:hypothetical protein
MGSTDIEIQCKRNQVTVVETTSPAHGDLETRSFRMTREQWQMFWTELDKTGWQQLPSPCPPVDPPPSSTDITSLEIEIHDGTTTKQITCGGADLGTPHNAIRQVFDDALSAAMHNKRRRRK